METVKNLREFYGGLSKDLKIIFIRSGIANFVFNVNPYTSIFIVALGATGTQLGLLNGLSLGLTAISSIMTGWLSDRFNRKTMFLIGAFVGIMVPTTYFLAGSLYWVIPAYIFIGFADGTISPPWTAMYANSIRNQKRGTVYGLANIFMLTPMLFAGIIGGEIVSMYGGLTADGIRPVYLVQAGMLALAWLIVWRNLSNRVPVREKKPVNIQTLYQDYREVLKREGVSSWVFMKSLGSLSIGLAGSFWMLYAAQVHNASALTIAYMVTARTVSQIITSPLSGALTDRIGRKKMIIGGRMTMYIAAGIFFILGSHWQYLIIAWVLMGISDATGVAWQAEEAELVDPNQRARMTALSVAAFNLLAVPASVLGGWLWDSVGKISPFIVMMLVDGFIRMPIIYKYVPESKQLKPSEDPDAAF